jgi:hypothetical protein
MKNPGPQVYLYSVIESFVQYPRRALNILYMIIRCKKLVFVSKDDPDAVRSDAYLSCRILRQ